MMAFPFFEITGLRDDEMNKEEIAKTAQRLWRIHEERNPRRLCRFLDIRIEEMPMGLDDDSIKGLIFKSSRCYCIVLNSDLDARAQDLIILHEIGHYALGHVERAACTCRNLFAHAESSLMEIEANEFVAEYLLNTKRTLEVLHETNSFYDTAKILCVPPAIMDFKWRMLRYYNLISRESPVYASSDCMAHLGNTME